MSTDLAQAMSKVVEVLSPLTSEERQRVVSASLALLGEGGPLDLRSKSAPVAASQAATPEAPKGISAQASLWMNKNGLTVEDLEHCFHIEAGSVTTLALPQKSTKRTQQALEAYLLVGFSAFLATGEPAFGDKEAREACEHFGCYDQTNHSKIYKSFGNKIIGSKSGGWKLTVPGIKAAGVLIKESASE